MIEFRHLQRLAQSDSRPHPTLSLYLNLDLPRDKRLLTLGELLKRKQQQMAGNGSGHLWEELASDREKVLRYVEELSPKVGGGLAVFSCEAKGLFEAYTLPLKVPNLLEIGPIPYIRPLVALASDYSKVLAVVTGRREGRFFVCFMGMASEESAARVVSEPASYERDGQQGRAGDSRVSRRADEELSRHLKRVGQKLRELVVSCECKQVALGGPRHVVELMQELLPGSVAEMVVGTFTIDPGAGPTEVARAVADVQAAARRRRQERVLNELVESLGPGGRATTGLNEVLASLYEGSVGTLLVRRGLTHPGGACPTCGRLRHVAGSCPICGGEMTPVADVINLAVAQALGSGAKLEQIAEPSVLDEHGGIAALLRYV